METKRLEWLLNELRGKARRLSIEAEQERSMKLSQAAGLNEAADALEKEIRRASNEQKR